MNGTTVTINPFMCKEIIKITNLSYRYPGKKENGRNGAHDSDEEGMVRLILSAGKAHGVRPADVVGTIAYHANFPGNTIGDISILDKHTLVVLEDLQWLEDKTTKLLTKEMEQHAAWPWLKEIKGAGLENTAKVIGLIEGVTFKSTGRSGIEAFDNMSKLRRFAGLAIINGKSEKRVKGQRLHYSSELRTMLWRLSQGFIMTAGKQCPICGTVNGTQRDSCVHKLSPGSDILCGADLSKVDVSGGKFYNYYIHKKEEYVARFTREGVKIVPTPQAGWRCKNCNAPFPLKRDVAGCCGAPSPEQVLKQETPGVIFLGHLDAMAKRKMMVMFCDMLWKYWRQSLGLPCKPSYIAGKEPIRQHEPVDFIG